MQQSVAQTLELDSPAQNTDSRGEPFYIIGASNCVVSMDSPRRWVYSQASCPIQDPPVGRSDYPENSSCTNPLPYPQHQLDFPLDTTCGQGYFDESPPPSYDEAIGQSAKINYSL